MPSYDSARERFRKAITHQKAFGCPHDAERVAAAPFRSARCGRTGEQTRLIHVEATGLCKLITAAPNLVQLDGSHGL